MGVKIHTKGMTNPYKFLDYYRKNDTPLFFGRERETETFVSDIVTARLVILFAKTGSGKSSLINAGVRPRLEELDYHTFWIRVEQDPTEAALTAFRRENFCLDAKPFVECLKEIVRKLNKPVVLFFDQFEEFFLFPASQESEAVKRFKVAAQRFVSDVGKLHRDRESGVHIVFSMREEFFHEMDVFRSEIPTIFGAESSLRLRWLDDDQARAAITQPALVAGVSFSEEFTTALIEDLKDSDGAGEGIEPARLQIVCDTIWASGCFDLKAYDDLGRARGILKSRLEKDIAIHLADDELKVFEKLLFELTHSQRQTKRVRVLDEIEQSLKVSSGSLSALIGKLEELRLIVKSKHSTGIFIEWTSDYVAGRARSLKDYVRGTLLERLLHKVRAKAEAKLNALQKIGVEALDLSKAEQGVDDEIEILYMSREDFEAMSRDAHLLSGLNADDTRFLFRASLEHGTHLSFWFEKAANAQVDTWQVLHDRITQEDTQSAQSLNAVRLLGEIGVTRDGATETKALEVLKLALEQPDLANEALEAVAQIGTTGAVQLLAGAIKREDLAPKTIAVLRQLKTSTAIRLLAEIVDGLGPFSLAAGTALSRIASDLGFHKAREAKQALAALLAKRGTDLFRLALEKGIEMQFWLQKAEESGVPVWSILRNLVSDQETPEALAQNVARLLLQTKDPRAEEIRTIPRAGHSETQRTTTERELLSSFSDKEWDTILRRISVGRCLPIIGPGASAGTLPTMGEIARHLALEFEYPFGDSGNLALVAQYVAVTMGESLFAKEKVSAMLRESQGKSRNAALSYEILAQLPLPIYVTMSHDTLLAEALEKAHKAPRHALCNWNKYIEDLNDGDRDFRPTVANPLIFYLCGRVDQPRSMVLTEEDIFDFVAAVSGSRHADVIPVIIQGALARSMQLFIGVTPLSEVVRWLVRFNFRHSMGGSHVLQMLIPSHHDESEPRVEGSGHSESMAKYFTSYFHAQGVKTYFGTSDGFLTELLQRRGSESHPW